MDEDIYPKERTPEEWDKLKKLFRVYRRLNKWKTRMTGNPFKTKGYLGRYAKILRKKDKLLTDKS